MVEKWSCHQGSDEVNDPQGELELGGATWDNSSL